jgi:hypothetical protein
MLSLLRDRVWAWLGVGVVVPTRQVVTLYGPDGNPLKQIQVP